MQETRGTWVRPLGQEDSLQKGMETHPSILAWKIPWPEDPGRLQPMGSQRVEHSRVTNTQLRRLQYEKPCVKAPRRARPVENAESLCFPLFSPVFLPIK